MKQKVESINIKLASPIRIRKWTQRILPNGKKVGEVTNSQTVNYKTLKPEPDGLFCEKIFGPIKDFECACGIKKPKGEQKFCSKCDVEFTSSRVRRYRLGYIKLAAPVTHIWYLKGRPSFLSLLLGISRKKLQSIVYCSEPSYTLIYKFFKNENSNIISNSCKKTNSVLNYQWENTNAENNLQIQVLTKYFITKLKKNFHQKKKFKISLNSIIKNSYYSEFNIVNFESIQNLQFFIYTFIPFFDKKKVDVNLKINTKFFELSPSDDSFKNLESDFLQSKNFSQSSNLSSGFNGMKSFSLKKKIFLNTALNKNLPSNLDFYRVKTSRKVQTYSQVFIEKQNFPTFNTTKLLANTQKAILKLKTAKNLQKNSVKTSAKQVCASDFFSEAKKISNQLNFKNFSGESELLQGKNFSQSSDFLTTLQKKNFFQASVSKKNSLLQFQFAVNSFYPIRSQKLVFKTSKSLLEFQNEWNKLLYYITCNSTKYDVLLPNYVNRSVKKSVIINNILYKSLTFLLSGTETIWNLLKSLNLPLLKNQLRITLESLTLGIQEKENKKFLDKFELQELKKLVKLKFQCVRRLKVVSYFQKAKLPPEGLIISFLPVLPPDLRPIVKMNENQIAVSDLNQLYKRIIYRNKRVKKYREKNYSIDSFEIKFNQRLLQEAVDALIDNGKGGTPLASALNGRPFKSLSQILKGKKGRFRQNLLGKRVDYSGRSVIVVEPKLQLHQCGLPKEMAIELFQPFIIREFKKKDKKTTLIKIKKLIRNQHPSVYNFLKKILKTHPILLNRAPTLHRLGIQAFQPKLVDGRAILLHPLVCPAFNADFDGDQMGVHIPLSALARAEAWKLMWSRNNILSPATGQPIIVPSQDMILGCYYLTTNLYKNVLTSTTEKNDKLKQQLLYIFSSTDQVLMAFQQKKISVHSLILIRLLNVVQIENFYEKPLEIRVDFFGQNTQIYSKYWFTLDCQSNKINQFIYTTPGKILLNEIILNNKKF